MLSTSIMSGAWVRSNIKSKLLFAVVSEGCIQERFSNINCLQTSVALHLKNKEFHDPTFRWTATWAARLGFVQFILGFVENSAVAAI